MGASTISLSLPSTSDAPARARAAIAQMPGIDSVREDALLVVSELVANAVLHSGATGDDPISVQVRRHDDRLTIRVRDAGRSGAGPRVRGDGVLGHGGFGLVLVDTLSRKWDTHLDGGRVVWAEMGLQPEARPTERIAS